MLRIRTFTDETNVFIQIFDDETMIYNKIIMGNVNGNGDISFSTNSFPYKSRELSMFINDVKANVPSKFSFDEFDNDDEGSFDGILYMEHKIIFCTCYGINSSKTYINIPRDTETFDLMISDLRTMQSILDEYAIKLSNNYDIICHVDEEDVPEPNDEPEKETNTVEKAAEQSSDNSTDA